MALANVLAAMKIAAEVEAAGIAIRDAKIAAEVEATRMSATESASSHRIVDKSSECKQAERERYEFWMCMIDIHSIWHLQGKTAGESPPPHALPARAAKLLGNVMSFYNAHFPPESQARTTPQTRAQVAQHARRTRSFMIRSMQVFLMIAS